MAPTARMGCEIFIRAALSADMVAEVGRSWNATATTRETEKAVWRTASQKPQGKRTKKRSEHRTTRRAKEPAATSNQHRAKNGGGTEKEKATHTKRRTAKQSDSTNIAS